MESATKSGIRTGTDGSSFIPASKRADGTTRKEIRVRPGYRPPEDIETYKNRSAEAWKNRGTGGVPGADPGATLSTEAEVKSKNAKRREAAKRKAAADASEADLSGALKAASLDDKAKTTVDWRKPEQAVTSNAGSETELDKQKKIRNALKKLKAVRELKEKKASGDKLTPDQLMKISKEEELVRDLNKLGYEGPELTGQAESNGGPGNTITPETG